MYLEQIFYREFEMREKTLELKRILANRGVKIAQKPVFFAETVSLNFCIPKIMALKSRLFFRARGP
jgi:hypothetical protein